MGIAYATNANGGFRNRFAHVAHFKSWCLKKSHNKVTTILYSPVGVSMASFSRRGPLVLCGVVGVELCFVHVANNIAEAEHI